MRTTLVACVLVLGVIVQNVREQKLEKAAIERAQNTLVSTFDSSLPKVSLKFFLESEAEGAKVSWEMNDCGEQSGNPVVDRGRDLPTCVEASFTLKDRRTVDVMVAVGTAKRGLHGAPTLFSSTITDENGTHAINLIELPAKIHRGRPKNSPRDRAPVIGNVLA
jgi:hypothetical protein